MKNEFTLSCERLPGTLQRVLGLVERRGFEALDFRAHTNGDDEYLITLHVVPSVPTYRDPDNLLKQLQKLEDVRRVSRT